MVPVIPRRVCFAKPTASCTLSAVIGLIPLSVLYRAASDIRGRLYDRGSLQGVSLDVPTVSIGNITVGGTGKTPLVALTAELLAEEGCRVGILTRGYGRREPRKRVLVSNWERVRATADLGGDEPVELARRLLGKAVVVADADRIGAASWARETLGVTCFVLDDGFQHRRAARDLDIVCIDATMPLFEDRVLPAGRLREGLRGLERADAFIITRSELSDGGTGIEAELWRRFPRTPVFHSTTTISRLTPLDAFNAGAESAPSEAFNGPAFVFCGIGNPAAFRKHLDRFGIRIAGGAVFADHQRYTEAILDKMFREARSSGAEALITTAKDAVKLEMLTNGRSDLPVLVAEIETRITEAAEFRSLLRRTLVSPDRR